MYKKHGISSYHSEECDRTGQGFERSVCISVSCRNLELSRRGKRKGNERRERERERESRYCTLEVSQGRRSRSQRKGG